MKPHDPAFPETPLSGGHNGMSLRCYLAAKAMQGLLSGIPLFTPYDQEHEAAKAVAMADALLAELNKHGDRELKRDNDTEANDVQGR